MDLSTLFAQPPRLLHVIAALAVAACATEPERSPSDPASTDYPPTEDDGELDPHSAGKADSAGVRWRMWPEPLDLAPWAPASATLAYGQCEQVEPSRDDVTVEINCGMPWSDVAWYRISPTLPVAAPDGQQGEAGADDTEPPAGGVAPNPTEMAVTFSFPDSENNPPRVRGSIHKVLPEGRTQKIIARSWLDDGDQLTAPIDGSGADAPEYYLYVARGRSLWPLWGKGTLDVTVELSLSEP